MELRPVNFSHVLPKGSYTRWKLLRKNVVIKCATCHRRWHNAGREALVRGDYGHADGWAAMFGLFDTFKAEYNRKA